MKAFYFIMAAAICTVAAAGVSVRGGGDRDQQTLSAASWASEAAVSAADAPLGSPRLPAFDLTINCPSSDDDKSAKDASFLP